MFDFLFYLYIINNTFEKHLFIGGFVMNGEAVVLEHSETKSFSLVTYKIIKRVFDIICSIIGIIFLIPIIIIIKIISLLSGDFKSIFFSQLRYGKNGKTFKLYKFRSMVPNADEVLEKLLKEDKKAAQEYKKNKKLKNDPRITKIGKIIRKASIDELPQLINVLKGDMSMIGNRPYLPREKEDIDRNRQSALRKSLQTEKLLMIYCRKPLLLLEKLLPVSAVNDILTFRFLVQSYFIQEESPK